MEFHDYRTLWEAFRKSIDSPTPRKFYDELRRIGILHAVRGSTQLGAMTTNQATCEDAWIEIGKPYYKLYPDMINLLLRTRLDVPSEYLRCPFETFCLRFPKNHNIPELTVEGQELRAVLVHECPRELDPKDGSIRNHRSVTAWMDFGETESDFNNTGSKDIPVIAYVQMRAEDGENIEDCLRQKSEGTEGRICDEGLPITVATAETIFRVAVAICFLATGADKIVEADVLSKDLLRFQQSDDKDLKEKLVQKAHKRGKKGWTVGREIVFPYRRAESHRSEGTGKELHFSHQRSAHFHAVRYGPGKSQVKVVFIRQLTVRPDLPPPPGRRGYSAKP